MLEKLLDFAGEHPVLTVVILLVLFGGIADIVSAIAHVAH